MLPAQIQDARSKRNPGANSGLSSRCAVLREANGCKVYNETAVKAGKLLMVAYSAPISLLAVSNSHSVSSAYVCSCWPRSPERRIRAKRSIPSSVRANPVDSSGSTKPAAEGNMAHRLPAMTRLRKLNRRHVPEWLARNRLLELRFQPGQPLSNTLAHAGSPSLSANSFATAWVTATPALVTPLLNRSTQTQPPSNT